MRRIALLTAVSLVSLLFAACSEELVEDVQADDENMEVVENDMPEEEPEEEEVEPREIPFSMDSTLSVEEDMVILEGTTNLPDGSLVSFELDHEEDLNVFDNAKIEVEDGSFYHEVDISGYPAGQVLIQSFILLNDLPEDDELYDGTSVD